MASHFDMMITSQEHFDFLALPPEVRNIILKYVLVPGEVYPRPSMWPTQNNYKTVPPKAPDTWCRDLMNEPFMKGNLRDFHEIIKAKSRDTVPHPLEGFSLLAACKQTYEEGCRLFYEDYIFHLPRGPVEYTQDWLNKLRPEHKDMIRSVCITFDPSDITSLAWTHFRTIYSRSPAIDALFQLSLNIWMRKIWFVGSWKTLEVVHMKSPKISLSLKRATSPKRLIHNSKQLERGMFDALGLLVQMITWTEDSDMQNWIDQGWDTGTWFGNKMGAWPPVFRRVQVFEEFPQ